MLKPRSRGLLLAGAAGVLIYWIVLVATLPDYGATWDEPGWFAIGDITLEYVLTLDPSLRVHEKAYGRLTALLSSVSHAVLSKRLNLLDPIPARHLPYTVMAALALASFMGFAHRNWGARAAFLAGAFLAVHPRVFSHAHNNPLDMSALAFTWATLFFYQSAVSRDRSATACRVMSMVTLGLLFSSRSPACYYLILTLGLWRGWLAVTRAPTGHLPSLGREIAENFSVFLLTAKLANPLLWNDSVLASFLLTPISFLSDSTRAVVPHFFLGHYYEAGATPWYYSPLMLVITLPLGMLAASFAGLWPLFIKRPGSSGAASLLAAVALVGIGKHLGGAGNYDGIRHFIEVIPVVCLAAALGIEHLSLRFAPARPVRLAALLGGAVLLEPVCALIALHPYSIIYFNSAAGGLQRADRLFELDYWGQSTREGMEWIVRERSDVRLIWAPIEAPLIALHASPSMTVEPMPSLRAALSADSRALVAFFRRKGFYRGHGPEDSLAAYCENNLKPVHQVVRGGVPLFSIYEWPPSASEHGPD